MSLEIASMIDRIPCLHTKVAPKVIHDGVNSASWHMAKDQSLIDSLSSLTAPLIRFYEWKAPTITHGYFINPEKYLKLDACKALGFDVAKRPTGGGILFHCNDFTFSVAIPKTHPQFSLNVLENYHFVNTKALQAVQELVSLANLAEATPKTSYREFCMAEPTQYDLLVHGLKIGGSAQRMTRFGFVHQASIFLQTPPWELIEELLHDGKKIVQAMKATSASIGIPIVQKKELQQSLIQQFLT